MSRSDSPALSRYDRHATMASLAAQFIGPAFDDETQDGRAALIAWLERRCRTMRAQGIAGAYHYDLPLHTELLRILAAEKAELAAIEIRSASPDADGGNSGPPSARNAAALPGDSSTGQGLTSNHGVTHGQG
jgi:hypothetical protein